MAFYKTNSYGESLNILESEVGLVVKTREATQAMAAEIDGRKIIKAGALYTNPSDETDLGIFLADIDMTDDAERPVSVVLQGRVRADRVAATVTAKKADLAAKGLHLV